MKILLLTALFPPDVSPASTYTKELAKKLSESHEVTVLTYGNLPESIPNVTMKAIDKNKSTLTRVAIFSKELFKLQTSADVILVSNGPSVELPIIFTRPKKPIVYLQSDSQAMVRSGLISYLQSKLITDSKKTIAINPADAQKPEWTPYISESDFLLETTTNNDWWVAHCNAILS